MDLRTDGTPGKGVSRRRPSGLTVLDEDEERAVRAEMAMGPPMDWPQIRRVDNCGPVFPASNAGAGFGAEEEEEEEFRNDVFEYLSMNSTASTNIPRGPARPVEVQNPRGDSAYRVIDRWPGKERRRRDMLGVRGGRDEALPWKKRMVR